MDAILNNHPVRMIFHRTANPKQEMPVDKSRSILLFGHSFKDLPRLFPHEYRVNRYFTAQYETALIMRMMNACAQDQPVVVVLYNAGAGEALARGAYTMQQGEMARNMKYILVHGRYSLPEAAPEDEAVSREATIRVQVKSDAFIDQLDNALAMAGKVITFLEDPVCDEVAEAIRAAGVEWINHTPQSVASDFIE